MAKAAGGYQDRCGYGPRLPLLAISPYSKVNYVDHHVTEQASILRFVEDNWSTGRIGDASFDARAGSLELDVRLQARRQAREVRRRRSGCRARGRSRRFADERTPATAALLPRGAAVRLRTDGPTGGPGGRSASRSGRMAGTDREGSLATSSQRRRRTASSANGPASNASTSASVMARPGPRGCRSRRARASAVGGLDRAEVALGRHVEPDRLGDRGHETAFKPWPATGCAGCRSRHQVVLGQVPGSGRRRAGAPRRRAPRRAVAVGEAAACSMCCDWVTASPR